uniref:C2H2-type domain-containing protein n=1 Tax=Oryzias latipes TaxID=8090 RepID=A0A3P9HES7_ORYLA
MRKCDAGNGNGPRRTHFAAGQPNLGLLRIKTDGFWVRFWSVCGSKSSSCDNAWRLKAQHGGALRQRGGVDRGSRHPGHRIRFQGRLRQRGSEPGVGGRPVRRNPGNREMFGGSDPQSLHRVLLGAVRGERGPAGQSGAAGGCSAEESRSLRRWESQAGKRFFCEHCDSGFHWKSDLKKHVELHKRKFFCQLCHESFLDEASLENHLSSHGSAQSLLPFRCPYCKRSYRREESLQNHLKRHQQVRPPKPFGCDQCKKTFRVNYHQRSHSGEKPFVCDKCGKRFFQAASLKQHERIHTGEKPYKCDQCGKAFRTDGNFYRHMRIHTGEKPFECGYCQKKFHQSNQLKSHLKKLLLLFFLNN